LRKEKNMAVLKNLCAKIPEELHSKLRQEQEQLGLTLSEYVEKVFKEHFEGGKLTMSGATRTLALQIPEELYNRLKEHLKKTGQTQKDYITSLVEGSLREDKDKED
jgi:hypothetical protein